VASRFGGEELRERGNSIQGAVESSLISDGEGASMEATMVRIFGNSVVISRPAYND
jgi:hypothetical protein